MIILGICEFRCGCAEAWRTDLLWTSTGPQRLGRDAVTAAAAAAATQVLTLSSEQVR